MSYKEYCHVRHVSEATQYSDILPSDVISVNKKIFSLHLIVFLLMSINDRRKSSKYEAGGQPTQQNSARYHK